MEGSEKRPRGRPKGSVTGHAKTSRSLRIGPVWDEAMVIAEARGETLAAVVEAALRRYVQRHRAEEQRKQRMKFSMVHRAGTVSTSKGEFPERFVPDAFDSQIGKDVPLKVGDQRQTGTLVAADVSPDGSQVELTIEIDESSTVAQLIRDGLVPGIFGRGGDMPPVSPA